MREIDLDTFTTAHHHGARVIDVREPQEYAAGHVPGATSIPMGVLPLRLDQIDKGRAVYVICQSGSRSASMTRLLDNAGYDAYSVADGTGGWLQSGRPVEEGN